MPIKNALIKKVMPLAAIGILASGVAWAEDDFEAKVRAYLLDNPEVIIEAIQLYQAKAELETQRAQREQASLLETTFKTPGLFPHEGADDTAITVVEFLDYQCGYCKRAFNNVQKLVGEHKDVRVVYIDIPILGPASTLAAQAALASRKQGKYLALHDALMQSRGGLNERRLFSLAEDVGLDVDQLKADMKAPEIAMEIQRNIGLMQQLGINGTPAFVFGGQLVPGFIDYAKMEELVDSMRKSS